MRIDEFGKIGAVNQSIIRFAVVSSESHRIYSTLAQYSLTVFDIDGNMGIDRMQIPGEFFLN